MGNFFARFWWRFSAANWEARAPPWPSNTAKNETRQLYKGQETSVICSPSQPDILSAIWLLHILWKGSQAAGHVRQQNMSILHLITLATPCCDIALQHRETWNTTHWSTLFTIFHDVLANDRRRKHDGGRAENLLYKLWSRCTPPHVFVSVFCPPQLLSLWLPLVNLWKQELK